MLMEFLYLIAFVTGSLQFGVSGRAVNISSAWFLPQEGFPVFYRYFGDKTTWNEAEAACSFHHADLLSVQTDIQMDAARAYLKELDVTDNVWIGLRKESPEKPFSWTSGERLLGEGYWTEPIPKTNEKLCAAIDPVADFRWDSFYCRGPQLASFVCELPVPDWAKKENGCLITSLPSLTVTLVPEVGVIQLLSDCGLDGTRRIACNGALSREEIIKRLSCDVDAFASTIFSRSTTADTVKEVHVEDSSWSDEGNQIDRHGTTKIFSAHPRHRRSADSIAANTVNTPLQGATTETKKKSSAAFSNVPSHAFPHSPYLASVRNAPSTRKPPIVQAKPRKTPMKNSTGTDPSPSPSPPLYKDLPVLIITGENLNDSASSATSENPPIVLMINNKDLDEPFLVPLSDDIFVNPSLSPVEVINVDLVEVDNLTNQTNPLPTEGGPSMETDLNTNATRGATPPRQAPPAEDATEESLNAVEEYRGAETPQRPNRGRLLTHSSHPSFYPRLLNRVLG